jgi:broad specificity phosphatase PhoE
MRIVFLRHAHAAHNAANDLYGHDGVYESEEYRDALLSDKGHAQAARTVLPHQPQRIYSSPLRRCIQTVRGFAPHTPIILEDGLIERQCNHPCNRRSSLSTIEATAANLDTSRLLHAAMKVVHETDEMFIRRVKKALYEIVTESQRNGYETILVVTHWDLMRTVFGVIVDNCETYTIDARSSEFI